MAKMERVVQHRHNIDVMIPVDGITLDGFLSLPHHARGIVIFAHGSGSSRHSPRNKFVAEYLYDQGFATLLTDLLTKDEELEDEKTRRLRFDISLLAKRLYGVVQWVEKHDKICHRPLGLFGASTGAASALVVAASLPKKVKAVISRGGRPDLAGNALGKVAAPTLLIVGGKDHEVIELNKIALEQLNKNSQMEIVAGATHLFEEEGALEKVAELATAWFGQHLKHNHHT